MYSALTKMSMEAPTRSGTAVTFEVTLRIDTHIHIDILGIDAHIE